MLGQIFLNSMLFEIVCITHKDTYAPNQPNRHILLTIKP